jgi:ABC-type uncharacterized transport system substrate-binding protein
MKRGSGLVPLEATRVLPAIRWTMRHLRGPLTIGVTLVLGILGSSAFVGAQQAARVPRIGVLFAGAPSTSSQSAAAFEQGMREHGWRENHTVVIESRFGEARTERMAEIAAGFVRLNVDVIVTSTDAGIASAKQRTHTIPIVMVNSTDPVETGFVASLARPGGNVTGLSGLSPELSAKMLEVLKEAVPRLTRVAIIWNPDIQGAALDHKQIEGARRSLNLQLQSIEVRRAEDLDRAFSAMVTGRAEALIVPIVNPLAFARRAEIARACPARPYDLRAEHSGRLAARNHLCGQDSEGRQARGNCRSNSPPRERPRHHFTTDDRSRGAQPGTMRRARLRCCGGLQGLQQAISRDTRRGGGST